MKTPHLFRVVEGPLDGDSVPDCGEQLCLGPHRYHKCDSDQTYVYEGIGLTSAEADPEEANQCDWPSDTTTETTAILPEIPPTPATPPAAGKHEPPPEQPKPEISSVKQILNWIADFLLWCVFLLICVSMTFRAPVIGLGIFLAGLLIGWIWKAAIRK